MSDIDTVGVDGLKVLDPKRPIRESDIIIRRIEVTLRAKLRHLTAMTASGAVQKPDPGFGQAFAGDAVEDRQQKKNQES